MFRRVKIGDLFEVETDRGMAYFIVSHKEKFHGFLIRVFKGFYEARPSNLNSILLCAVQFSVFFPVRESHDPVIIRNVGHFILPSSLSEFPLFKCAFPSAISDSGKAEWWLWDGIKEWRIGEISETYLHLDYREVINDKLLKDRIESEWNSNEYFI